MPLDFEFVRRPLGVLGLSLLFVYVATGVYELFVRGGLGTATFVMSLVTYATVVAAVVEYYWGVGTE